MDVTTMTSLSGLGLCLNEAVNMLFTAENVDTCGNMEIVFGACHQWPLEELHLCVLPAWLYLIFFR